MGVSLTAGKGKELFQQVFPPEQWKVHAKFQARSGKVRILLIRKDQRSINPEAAIVDLDTTTDKTVFHWNVAKEGNAWKLSEDIADEHSKRSMSLPLKLDYDLRWERAKAPEPVEEIEPPPNPNAGLANFGRF